MSIKDENKGDPPRDPREVTKDSERYKRAERKAEKLDESMRQAFIAIEANDDWVVNQGNALIHFMGIREFDGDALPTLFVKKWPLTQTEKDSLPKSLNGLRTAVVYEVFDDLSDSVDLVDGMPPAWKGFYVN